MLGVGCVVYKLRFQECTILLPHKSTSKRERESFTAKRKLRVTYCVRYCSPTVRTYLPILQGAEFSELATLRVLNMYICDNDPRANVPTYAGTNRKNDGYNDVAQLTHC